MLKRWLITTVAVILSLLFIPFPASAYDIDFPDPVGYVNDFANVLNNESELNNKLKQLEESDGTQVFVITTDELPEGVTLENFIPRLTDQSTEWSAGQEEFDNGVIFTIVISDRTMRIDVGYGLEGALPDLLTKHIQDDYVKPYFQEGDYDLGVETGVDKIVEAVRGEYTTEDVEQEQEFNEAMGMFLGPTFICMMIFTFIILPYLGAFLGRTKSWWLGGVIGGILGLILGIWLISFTVFGWIRFLGLFLFPLLLTPLGLLFDYVLSKNYRKRKSRKLPVGFFHSWGGFSSGGSSFGGSSGGGFSGGGGGSFGGGGSSSSW